MTDCSLSSPGGFWGVAFWTTFYKSLFKTNPPADLADHAQALSKNLKESGRHSALLKMMFASKASCTARIPEVRSDFLVVMGSKDPDFSKPADEVDWIVANFPKDLVQSTMIEGAGHYPHQEFPEQVAKEILEFLQ